MSKFNYEDSNPKNVFSGEDGILFVHQRENGENCIEINSDNLMILMKRNFGSGLKHRMVKFHSMLKNLLTL